MAHSEKWHFQHSELREGDVIIMIGSPEILLQEKAEMTINKSVQDPKMLKIYLDNGVPWLFDVDFDENSASRFLTENFPYC